MFLRGVHVGVQSTEASYRYSLNFLMIPPTLHGPFTDRNLYNSNFIGNSMHAILANLNQVMPQMRRTLQGTITKGRFFFPSIHTKIKNIVVSIYSVANFGQGPQRCPNIFFLGK